MQIGQFSEMTQIPFYYQCHMPIIHEQIKSLDSKSYLSLYPNAELYGVPFLSTKKPMRFDLIKKVLNYSLEHYTIQMTTKPSYEEGLVWTQDQIRQGHSVIISGTSYYLPYHDDYLNPHFIKKHISLDSGIIIADHWLLVTGFENDEVQIYDPVPSKYVGSISNDTFHQFWAGNRNIAALKQTKGIEKLVSFGVLDVQLRQRLTDENLEPYFNKLLTTAAIEFMRGYSYDRQGVHYFVGRSVSLYMKKLLEDTFLHEHGQLSQLSHHLFDMRWSKYYLRDLLTDMNMLFGEPYLDWQSQQTTFAIEWEKLHKQFVIYTQRNTVNPIQFEAILHKLDTLITEEDTFFQAMIERSHHAHQT